MRHKKGHTRGRTVTVQEGAGRAPRRSVHECRQRWAVALAVLVVSVLLYRVLPVLADDQCKLAAPLSQSACVKDGQCCAGLVCAAPSGDKHGNCQPGCRIGGVLYASGTANPTNACQACSPAVSTTAWTNNANGTPCTAMLLT